MIAKSTVSGLVRSSQQKAVAKRGEKSRGGGDQSGSLVQEQRSLISMKTLLSKLDGGDLTV
jgi:hypothetical protein